MAVAAYIDPETFQNIFGGPFAPILGWIFATVLAVLWPLRFLYSVLKARFLALSRPFKIGVLLMLVLGVGSIGQAILNWFTEKKPDNQSAKAPENRIGSPYSGVIVLGMDGLDPKITEKLMDEGALPNFAKLRQNGGYKRLATSNPPESPVAWSTIATGCESGEHGIFDFLHRDPKTYFPFLSLRKSSQSMVGTKYEKARLRDGFWMNTSEAGIPTTVIRWPVAFPAEKVNGRFLSGFGVPDLLGGEGKYLHFTSEPVPIDDPSPRNTIKVEWDGQKTKSTFPGPALSKDKNVTLDIFIARTGKNSVRITAAELPAGFITWTGGTSVDALNRKVAKTATGTTDVKAECGNSDKSVKIKIVAVSSLTVTGANQIGTSANHLTPVATGDVEIVAVLTPTVDINYLPTDFITWTGGTAGADQLHRKVSKGTPIKEDVEATCGDKKKVTIIVLKVEFTPTPKVDVKYENTKSITATITPNTAASFVSFVIGDATIVTVSPGTASGSPQTLTLTGQTGKAGDTTLKAQANATDFASIDVSVYRKLYDENPVMNTTPDAGRAIPWTHNNIQASPGEKMIFSIIAVDKDKYKEPGDATWTEEDSVASNHTIEFSVSGNAEFDSAGSGSTTKSITGLASGNVTLVLKAAADWPNGTTVTVTATITDTEADPVVLPDKGKKKDAPITETWTIVKRTQAPTAMHQVGPPAGWVAAPGEYTYKMDPDIGAPGAGDYTDQTVLESFGAITAEGFTMNDLEPAWKTAHPTLTTPDAVAQFLWNSGNNGTFVIDAADLIGDRHSGFGDVSPFTAAAKASGVIGYALPQTYSCGTTTVGSYTIHRKWTSGAITIKKD